MSDKVKVLIAYNDDISESSRQFFDDCATDIRNFCAVKGIDFQIITPPQLETQNLMDSVLDSQICYIASHGTNDAIVNEKSNDVISIRTTNYNLDGKALFAVSCCCAETLKDELMRIGLKLFVGYRLEYREFPGYDEFYTTANSGLKVFVNGASVSEMKDTMYKVYDDCYKSLDAKYSIAADALLDNRERLIVDGDINLHIGDLS